MEGFRLAHISVCEKCYRREDAVLLDQTAAYPELTCKPIEDSHRSDRLSKHTEVVDTTSKNCSVLTKIIYFLVGAILAWIVAVNITIGTC